MLAVDNFTSPSDTRLILNRVGGNLASGASTIGSLFGVLYDDAEQPLSFTLSSNSCQLRARLDNNFLRTTPAARDGDLSGRSGWLRLWGTSDIGLLGSVISLSASAGGVNIFQSRHNLHKFDLYQQRESDDSDHRARLLRSRQVKMAMTAAASQFHYRSV